MLDLKGREIRISESKFPRGIEFAFGDRVLVRSDGMLIPSSASVLQIDCHEVIEHLREGDVIKFGEEGTIFGEVEEVEAHQARLVMKGGGLLAGNSPVYLPVGLLQHIPILRKEDYFSIDDIAVKHKFDYIVVPYVQTAKDIEAVREALGFHGKGIHILAKITNMDAVQNFTSIVRAADGIVLLRNELCFDFEPEKMVIAQKWIMQASNKAAKPVFIQSQVLEGLVGPETTAARQETQDISNAVLDGADVFILSHETSVGHNPLNATILLAKAIAEAENIYDHEQAF